jgi:hypothetical protein
MGKPDRESDSEGRAAVNQQSGAGVGKGNLVRTGVRRLCFTPVLRYNRACEPPLRRDYPEAAFTPRAALRLPEDCENTRWTLTRLITPTAATIH